MESHQYTRNPPNFIAYGIYYLTMQNRMPKAFCFSFLSESLHFRIPHDVYTN